MQRPETTSANAMGTEPVGRLLLRMSVPMMLAMLVQALYNAVDSYYVAKLGQDALNAVSMAFPIQSLMTAISTGVCVGMNALLSHSLGTQEREEANRAAGNGLLLAVISAIVCAVAGVSTARAFFRLQTDIPGIVAQGTIYLQICCGLSLGMFVGTAMERLLQSIGRSTSAMASQGLGAIINIVFDPLLIFGWGPFPPMGVAGAAVATVLGQTCGAGLSILLNRILNREITFAPRYLLPRAQTLRRILGLGVPTMVMCSVGSVMVFCVNQILIAFTDAATAAFGVCYKLQSFVFMPVSALNTGMVPIVAYNAGARRPDRIRQTIRAAFGVAITIMVAGLAVAQIFPAKLLGLFEASGEMLSIGVTALRIISLGFLFGSISVVSLSTFQGVGNGVLSMLVSIARQLLALLPAAWLLSLSGRLELIWFAFPIAEIIAASLSGLLLARMLRLVIDPLAVKAHAPGDTDPGGKSVLEL